MEVNGQSRTGADRSVAHARATQTGQSDRTDILKTQDAAECQNKALRSARNLAQTWEQEVAEFEMKFAEKVDEDAKILALKSMMPEVPRMARPAQTESLEHTKMERQDSTKGSSKGSKNSVDEAGDIIGGRSQTDHSSAHNHKKKSTSESTT